MDEEEEFDDIELDAVALAAVAGGQLGNKEGLLTDDNQRLQSFPRFSPT